MSQVLMFMAEMQTDKRAGCQAAFTFLEVMVAVAILAIAFVTLIGSQSQSVSVAGESRFRITAALLAQQKLAELESMDFESLSGGSDDFGDDYPGYSWRAEVTDVGGDALGIEEGDDLLKSVDLTVSQGENRSYAVKVLVMRQAEKTTP